MKLKNPSHATTLLQDDTNLLLLFLGYLMLKSKHLQDYVPLVEPLKLRKVTPSQVVIELH